MPTPPSLGISSSRQRGAPQGKFPGLHPLLRRLGTRHPGGQVAVRRVSWVCILISAGSIPACMFSCFDEPVSSCWTAIRALDTLRIPGVEPSPGPEDLFRRQQLSRDGRLPEFRISVTSQVGMGPWISHSYNWPVSWGDAIPVGTVRRISCRGPSEFNRRPACAVTPSRGRGATARCGTHGPRR